MRRASPSWVDPTKIPSPRAPAELNVPPSCTGVARERYPPGVLRSPQGQFDSPASGVPSALASWCSRRRLNGRRLGRAMRGHRVWKHTLSCLMVQSSADAVPCCRHPLPSGSLRHYGNSTPGSSTKLLAVPGKDDFDPLCEATPESDQYALVRRWFGHWTSGP